jgi:hypothetical protein
VKATSSAPKKKATPQHSAIIRECVRYLQSVAAFEAGLEAETGELEISGAGGPLGKAALDDAEMALAKLVALTSGGKKVKVFSLAEMKAMATACETLITVDASTSVLNDVQADFVESFARAAAAYFKDAAEIARKEDKHVQG